MERLINVSPTSPTSMEQTAGTHSVQLHPGKSYAFCSFTEAEAPLISEETYRDFGYEEDGLSPPKENGSHTVMALVEEEDVQMGPCGADELQHVGPPPWVEPSVDWLLEMTAGDMFAFSK